MKNILHDIAVGVSIRLQVIEAEVFRVGRGWGPLDPEGVFLVDSGVLPKEEVVGSKVRPVEFEPDLLGDCQFPTAFRLMEKRKGVRRGPLWFLIIGRDNRQSPSSHSSQ